MAEGVFKITFSSRALLSADPLRNLFATSKADGIIFGFDLFCLYFGVWRNLCADWQPFQRAPWRSFAGRKEPSE